MARGVAFAHQNGVIHRDLKPDNVLVDADGAAKVVDFGLAKADRLAGAELTRDGQVLGTPHYMSPEQARGTGEVTAATDLYSLGGMLFSLVTGEPPHGGNSAAEVITAVLTDESPTIRTTPAAARLGRLRLGDLDAVVARATARRPEARYVTADDFADDLQRLLDGDRPLATSDGLVNLVTRELTRDHHQRTFDGWSWALYRIGAIVGIAHVAMFFVGEQHRLIPRGVMLAGIAWVIHLARGGQWIPRTTGERPVWSIWIGYLAVLVFVNLAYWGGQIDDHWVFTMSALCSGMGFVGMAGHVWGGTAILGGCFFAIAGGCLAIPAAAPLLLGGGWAGAMLVLGYHYRPSIEPPPATAAQSGQSTRSDNPADQPTIALTSPPSGSVGD